MVLVQHNEHNEYFLVYQHRCGIFSNTLNVRASGKTAVFQ